ncbi:MULTISPECIES: dihydrolipoamide acetyltransferase family protein [Actinoalloteichus]|uniref:Dihydrolipoamide acetyltransferase component of pyruvate dehydrogenase complex n=1 Tax=Actinoalloteichus fjordicus TaxID=1612552 RepID=A0AAC9PVK1_9PSEU|nr:MULTISPECIES: dihydrolipoamide acetyltransferase family protein [Actinoalloteichus]APU17976.1 dihydrolipoamide acyltransferase component [Actinoalloteichus fjordicus]APU24055.1 dihydrolipoamide acyltransferase component [Actinoalloteichus sp. GBA129-24]
MPQLKHFPLPDTGEGLTEAEIITWHVAAGDTVTVNQIIVEIETAKAVVELPCPFAGQVSQLLVDVGQTVEVGVPIIAIDIDPNGPAGAGASADGQTVNGSKPPEEAEGRVANLVGYGPRTGAATRRPRKQSGSSTPQAQAPAPQAAPAPPVVPAPSVVPARAAAPAAGEQARTTGRVPLAKPPVRKLAKDAGIDLRTIIGSGADGVITRDDVTSAVAAAAAPAGPIAGQRPREERVPIRGVRRATAQAMVHSAFTAPHVTEFLTIDVTPMMELRARLKTHPAFQGVKITPLAFAAKALCLAVRRTPDVNAAWDEQAGEIVYKSYVHLGIAAATPRGLVVPKVREAQDMSLRELAEALDSLATTAREGRTTPADMVDGTITITNVGVFGVDTGTPILNPGESAILALGAIRDMPWVVDGQVVPRKVCQLALSFDHRVVDGQQGSQFLADIGALLAEPGLAMTY